MRGERPDTRGGWRDALVIVAVVAACALAGAFLWIATFSRPIGYALIAVYVIVAALVARRMLAQGSDSQSAGSQFPANGSSLGQVFGPKPGDGRVLVYSGVVAGALGVVLEHQRWLISLAAFDLVIGAGLMVWARRRFARSRSNDGPNSG